jgi:hypothetical protein
VHCAAVLRICRAKPVAFASKPAKKFEKASAAALARLVLDIRPCLVAQGQPEIALHLLFDLLDLVCIHGHSFSRT